MDQPYKINVTADKVTADDILYCDGNVWVVIMVTNIGVWVKHRENGSSMVMLKDEFDAYGFERWDSQGPMFKIFKDEGYEKA